VALGERVDVEVHVTETPLLVTLILLLVAVALIVWIIKRLAPRGLTVTVMEGQRGLVYRYGKFTQDLGPGSYWMLFGREMRIVPVNEQILAVAGQEVMTADRMAVRISALATYKILHPRKALEKSNGGYYQPVYYATQLALRDVVAALPLETLVDGRTKIDADIAAKAKAAFAEEGCELISVAIRDLVLPAEVRRLATDVTRAKMEAAASLERARGEQASLRALANAARLIKGNPELMNLRVLQALASSPGKTAPTIILGGSAGVVPVPAGAAGPAAGEPDNDAT
jgi:regulator of protease activity HflC (stomatin/prohibitin superfamily)